MTASGDMYNVTTGDLPHPSGLMRITSNKRKMPKHKTSFHTQTNVSTMLILRLSLSVGKYLWLEHTHTHTKKKGKKFTKQSFRVQFTLIS